MNVQDKYKIEKLNVCLSVCMYVRIHACLHMDICMGLQGFGGSWEKGYLFSGSWGALVIIFKGAGKQAHGFRDLGSPAKSKT